MNPIRTSKYHIFIVSLYLLLYVYFFLFTESPQSLFAFSLRDVIVLLPLIIVAIIVFFVANYFLKFGVIGVHRKNLSSIPLLIVYASVLIALPEEILFRGFIQTYFHSLFSSSFIVIVLSSVLFGFAHILNGAKGFSPKQWNWKLVFMTFLAGLFLGFCFYSTGSLVVPVIFHTVLILVMKVFIK